MVKKSVLEKKKTGKQLLIKTCSLSACTDSQLENCDIGKVGYGGALTVHFIDNNLIVPFLKMRLDIVQGVLGPILRKFNQNLTLQISNNLRGDVD